MSTDASAAVRGTGHGLHLARPAEVARLIGGFVPPPE